MQKKPPSSFCAGAAIAAALALGSTGALAQNATAEVPTIAPPAPVAAAPAPSAAPVMTQNPVVQAVPAEPAAAEQPQNRAAVQARQPASRPAARSPAVAATVPAAPRVPAPAAAIAPAATPPAAPVIAPLPEPVPAPAATAPSGDDGLTGGEAGLLGLLAIAGLGGAGLIAARSRRRPPIEEEEALEPATIAPAPTDEVVPVAAAIPATVPVSERPAASPERFAMPAGPVPAGAEREALLQRMVAAPPDEANPFVSRKRRINRARVLLAERERELRDRSTEPFDWRTYRPTGAKSPDRTEAEISRVPYPT